MVIIYNMNKHSLLVRRILIRKALYTSIQIMKIVNKNTSVLQDI